MADNDRAVAERDTAGLVKLVIVGDRVAGAGILAPNAGEIIGMWVLAIAQRVTLGALAGTIIPYPTRSEAAKRAISYFFVPRLFALRTKALVRMLTRLP
jgi:pyruvate/2-oxoglutarate dehydrogenase complex dihydrolipoamide dehydrogenase (E3) component